MLAGRSFSDMSSLLATNRTYRGQGKNDAIDPKADNIGGAGSEFRFEPGPEQIARNCEAGVPAGGML